ncbi:hypothetical protein BIW11_12533 [Tropilaelaps mercedesae]|uniref:C2H2-type domain-containing protein n=1 Tax=Tropilaelaps mercedesae TaxID=418985 RepID=A0A1V9X6H2_9ACAR|nr:hypothetical protein BIW11_12533 [Tropilaelaps mercedesae]
MQKSRLVPFYLFFSASVAPSAEESPATSDSARTGEKPFACELCSYRTKQQSTLTRHMRTVHAPKSENGLPNSGGVQTIFDEGQLLMLAANQAAASNMLPL